MWRIINVVRAKQPWWEVEQKLEQERQELLKARQDPSYNETADIVVRLDRARLAIQIGQ